MQTDTDGNNGLDPSPALVGDPQGCRKRQIVRLVLEYISNHYSRPLQRDDVAKSVKMNSAYVSTIFTEVMGTTFQDYLKSFRLQKALELLRNPIYRISEVAAAVGYESANHFREVFKTEVGISPTEWRNLQ
jgi:two-component system response regulator YesN